MKLMLELPVKKVTPGIQLQDGIFLIGSCFTQHIGNALASYKLHTLQNPHGILFAPNAIAHALETYASKQNVKETDLFYLNEMYHSWAHHSHFSAMDTFNAVNNMNAAINEAHRFLLTAQWVIITLGSSFTYNLTTTAADANALGHLAVGDAVSNCHRAPAAWFNKIMLNSAATYTLLDNAVKSLQQINPTLKFIFTISPVRHVRDGVVENNRSKGRLIEAVHQFVETHDNCYYFPAYELVIDILRDYRFYDVDWVHPNYVATEYVLQQFMESYIDDATATILKELKELTIARQHKPVLPKSEAHKLFMKKYYERSRQLQQQYPFLNLAGEIAYFSAVD